MRHTVTVEVDVDLCDFETADLEEELRSRQPTPMKESLNEIYYAFKHGREGEAVELTRKFVCDELGKIL